MNKDQSDRFRELCALIAIEQNQGKFTALVEELDRILSSYDERRNNELRQNELQNRRSDEKPGA